MIVNVVLVRNPNKIPVISNLVPDGVLEFDGEFCALQYVEQCRARGVDAEYKGPFDHKAIPKFG